MSLTITSGKASALATAGTSDNPIFAIANFASGAVITSNRGVSADGDLVNATTGSTYDAWRPATSAGAGNIDFNVDMGAVKSVDFVGVVGANVYSLSGVTVEVWTSADGVSYGGAPIATITPTSYAADAAWFVAVSNRYMKVRLTNVPALAQAIVPCIFIGKAIQSPRRTYQGYSPIITPTEVDLQSNVSAGGHYLGSAVVRRGSTFGMELQNLSPAFTRGAEWTGFQTAFNEGKPTFSAWRPTTYPQDLHYIWRDGAPIRPTNSGPLDHMSLGIEARVFER